MVVLTRGVGIGEPLTSFGCALGLGGGIYLYFSILHKEAVACDSVSKCIQ